MNGELTGLMSSCAIILPSVIKRAQVPASPATSGGIASPNCRIMCVCDLYEKERQGE